MRGLPVLLAAATLCLGGILRVWQAGQDGWLLAGAGLILVGAWLALEVRRGDDK
jgi:glucose dehydrogenase